MEKKLAMLVSAERGVPVAELCREMGVSRDSFYVWRRRFAADGLAGLEDRSRRPLRSPNATSPAMEDEIVRLRKELEVDNGADAIGWHLRRLGHTNAPSDRTIHRILVRRGMVTPQPEKRPKSSWRRFEFDRPNECWQIDATSWSLRDGTPVTIMDTLDDHSRVTPSLVATTTGATTELALEAMFAGANSWGLPAMVLSDNGRCFAGRDNGVSAFEATLAAVGVQVIHSRPFHPQTCGKIERFHQTLKRWLHTRPAAATLAALQDDLDAFAETYNHHRLHKAHGTTPAERHAATTPAAPGEPIVLEQPSTISITAVGVAANGTASIGGRWRASVGTELAGRRVTLIRYGDRAALLDGSRLLVRHYLDPTKTYLPSGKRRGGPRRRPY